MDNNGIEGVQNIISKVDTLVEGDFFVLVRVLDVDKKSGHMACCVLSNIAEGETAADILKDAENNVREQLKITAPDKTKKS